MKAMVCNKPPDMKLEYEQNRGFHEYGMIIYQNAKIGRKWPFFWFCNFRKQILVFMNENYDPAFFSCDHCIRKNALKMLF